MVEQALRFDVSVLEAATVFRGHGTLGSTTSAAMRDDLLRCLAEHPHALIVDLGEVTVADKLSLMVFAVVARQASIWPGIPFVVVMTRSTARSLARSGLGRTFRVRETLAQALDTVGQERSHTTYREFLPPVRGAARHARAIVTEACIRWDLEHLLGSACLVATELVTNAVRHAETTMWLRVTRRGHRLLLAVEDGGAGVPVRQPMPSADAPEQARGLALVDQIADRWGYLTTRSGKVVWAVLHG